MNARQEGVILHAMVETFERSEQTHDRIRKARGIHEPLVFLEALSYLRALSIADFPPSLMRQAFEAEFPDVAEWLWSRQATRRGAAGTRQQNQN